MLAMILNAQQLAQVLLVVLELLHLLEDLLQGIARLESLAPRLDQLQQVIPQHVHIALARVDALNVVVVLLLEHLGNVNDIPHTLLERANVRLNGLLLLEGRLNRLQVKTELVRDHQLLRVIQPLLAHRRLLVELAGKLLQVFLAH